MKKDHIEILDVKTHKLFTHQALAYKNFVVRANVKIKYYDLTITCNLVRGIDQNTSDPFYFLELPCQRFKNKFGNFYKSSCVFFDDPQKNKEFQDLAFGLIIERNPQIFNKDIKQLNKPYIKREENA